MEKAIVVFAPTVKNTEALAEYAADGLEKGGVHVTLKNVMDASIDELTQYDTIVLFCPTRDINKQTDSPINLHSDLNDLLVAAKNGTKARSKHSDNYSEKTSKLMNITSAA
jgi:flavodoxin